MILCIVIQIREIRKSEEKNSFKSGYVVSWYDRSFVVDLLSYFSFQSVLHDWYNKDRGMCYPVCGMVHIKVVLLQRQCCSEITCSRPHPYHNFFVLDERAEVAPTTNVSYNSLLGMCTLNPYR